MKIQYCSDLHLEFQENKKFLLENPIVPTAEVLILAGDIIPFSIFKVYTNLFFDSFNFLKTAILEEKSFKRVIVTHHVPTMLNYPPQYKGSAINQAFATELSEFIEENEIDYWLYGHHHYNSEIFEIGKTKLLTNQLGYVRSNEHLGYRNNAIFDIQYLG